MSYRRNQRERCQKSRSNFRYAEGKRLASEKKNTVNPSSLVGFVPISRWWEHNALQTKEKWNYM